MRTCPVVTTMVVAVLYLILVFLLTAILHVVERRLRIPGLELEAKRG
jgi:ABC-type amino acid transport system permease subunit